MPVVTQPNLIEQSDFSGGWSPDGAQQVTDPSVLIDVSNVLLDRNSGSLAVRAGFERVADFALDGYVVKQLFHFNKGGPNGNTLVAVLSTETSGTDNVQLWMLDLDSNFTPTRFDDVGVEWDNPEQPFWFISIDGILYGGNKGNPMFSYDPDGPTYDGDASTGNWKTVVDDVDGGVDTATEYGRDFAWTGKEHALYGGAGKVYIPQRNIRYDTWEDGQRYQKGDRISIKSGLDYWKSFKCIDSHTADAASKPGSGVDQADFWQKVRLSLPKNDDNETADAWARVPLAAQTSIAAWYADRLWLRFDGQGDNSRLQFSAPIKIDKGEDIPDTTWDPTNFAPGSDFRGTGGGWLPFNDGKHHGPITALHPFGQYLIVFKRRAVYALSGADDTSFQVRRIGRASGCVGSRAIAELGGLVYFLSDQGLMVTDGTVVEPAEGNEKWALWLKTYLDTQMQTASDDGREANLSTWKGFIVISLPDASREDFTTVFYDPQTGSAWPTNLPILDGARFRLDGVDRYAFTAPPEYTSETLVYEFDAESPNVPDKDDDGAAGSAGMVDIEWRLQSAWLNFGLMHEERRIRRVWFTVSGDLLFTIGVASDWESSAASTKDVQSDGSDSAEFIEGEYTKDSHAISMYLSGPEAPAKVFGYAVHTQPRRRRYHA